MLKFERNMGSLDRGVRVVVGVALLIAGPMTSTMELPAVLEMILGALGIFAILSAILSYCLLYEFTGSDTRAK